jgi:hypothetical protein
MTVNEAVCCPTDFSPTLQLKKLRNGLETLHLDVQTKACIEFMFSLHVIIADCFAKALKVYS